MKNNGKFREIAKARVGIKTENNKLDIIHRKVVENILCEKAGEALPYSYRELYEEAENCRKEIKEAPERLSDEAAELAADIFPKLSGKGALIPAGTRINFNGVVKRAAADLWDTAENSPDNAPALWEDINQKGEYREIPETITAGLAFSKDECGWWKGVLYKSLIDNNVWNPEQYAAGWEAAG